MNKLDRICYQRLQAEDFAKQQSLWAKLKLGILILAVLAVMVGVTW